MAAGEPFAWGDAVGWLGRHGRDVDVLHVHFGMEQVDLDGLRLALDAADRAGVAVVWTVHDLTNPHLVDQSSHEAQVALLARRSAGLLTLTPGAAAEVERRWGRRPAVVPHPHLAPTDVLARPRPPSGDAPPQVVAVPLGVLRPAVDPGLVAALLHPAVQDVLDELVRAGRDRPVLRVQLREEVLRPGFPRADPALVRRLREADADGRLELVVGPRTPEAEMWRDLGGLAALVLPYRWGTHSGWVEACHDVGTPVLAPDLGRWAEQQRVHLFRRGPDGPDPASLAGALRDALERGPRGSAVLEERMAGRGGSVAEHDRLHRLAAAGGRW